MNLQSSKKSAQDFLSFVDASPTRKHPLSITQVHVRLTCRALAFHAVQSSKDLLTKAGFEEIKVSEIIDIYRVPSY